MILSIDPGFSAKGGTGYAVWGDTFEHRLFEAGLIAVAADLTLEDAMCEITSKLVKTLPSSAYPDELVIERPRVYPGKGKGDQNDLIDLALLAGRLSTLGRAPVFVNPAEWKGQVPKEVSKRLVRERLSEVELARIPDHGTKTHNVYDAIDIGLWYLGSRREKPWPR